MYLSLLVARLSLAILASCALIVAASSMLDPRDPARVQQRSPVTSQRSTLRSVDADHDVILVPRRTSRRTTTTRSRRPQTSIAASSPIPSTAAPLPSSATTTSSVVPEQSIWQPLPGATWQIMLDKLPSAAEYLSSDYSIFDIDAENAQGPLIKAMHDAGKKVICYFSAGTFEATGRGDAAAFPISALGNTLPEWPDERWVDFRVQAVRDIMVARMQAAHDKGCDAVDPDNMDGYANDHGFSNKLTATDQIEYMRFLSDHAHSMGMAIGLKNAGGIVGQCGSMTEFAVNEECVVYGECDIWQKGYITAKKPVFHIEYPGGLPNPSADVVSRNCGNRGFSSLLKTEDLDDTTYVCGGR